MAAGQQTVDIYLDRAIGEFNSNPLARQLMRRFANEMPELFKSSALRHLGTSDESQAHRFMTALILRQDRAFDLLLAPGAESRNRALHLLRRFMGVDPSVDVKLARHLPDRHGTNLAIAFDGPRGARVLDLLDETSPGRRLLPILGHLTDNPDPQISARATLFIGHRVQNPVWAETQLEKNDERVRANAIESIWGLKTPAARAILERCVNDPSNRVAGNALVGLYILGEPEIIQQVARMATAPQPRFRATAAWAMGQISDPAFATQLKAMLKDPDPMVRSAVLRSLVLMRRNEAVALDKLAANETNKSPVELAAPIASVVDPADAVPLEIAFDIHLDGQSFSTSAS